MAARLALIAAFICSSAQDLDCDTCSLAEFDAAADGGGKSKCCIQDVTATTDKKKTVDSFWSIFGLSPEYESIKIRKGADWSHLTNFCQNEKNTYKEDTVLWCGGCTDHLVSDPRAKAALLYNSKLEKAPAYKREVNGKTAQKGLVSVWSLGSRIPAVLCDRGVLQCICEDSAQQWAEFEPSCVRGQNCSAPSESMFEEGASAGSIEPAVDIVDASWPECTSKEHPRAPIGGSFCEDMELAHCEHAYSRSHGGHYHRCQIEPDTFRKTHALLLSQSEAQALADEAQSWGIQNFYNPNLPWKVETENFTTSVLEKPEAPPADEFEKAVRARMEQQTEAHPNRGIFMKMSTESTGTFALQHSTGTRPVLADGKAQATEAAI